MSNNNNREKFTNTSYFLQPVFQINFSTLASYGFIDSFLIDHNRDKIYDNTIYALFKPDKNQIEDLNTAIEEWEDKSIVLNSYDYEGGFVVVEFLFPEKFKNDLQLFKEGKYSKFSKEYKEMIPKKVSAVLNNGLPYVGTSLQHMVFEKSDKMKAYWKDKLDIDLTDKDEHWGIINIETETLKIENYDNYGNTKE